MCTEKSHGQMEKWQPTQEQHTWLMPHLTKFRQVKCDNEPAFWAQFYREWLESWPEQDILWPDHPAEDELPQGQEKELHLAEKARKQVVVGLPMDIVLHPATSMPTTGHTRK
ncbi:hypothetical protein F4604DRAFT_1672750 [Suillus subluteus]|nr:hypothetical protein F4604DRAFT_1672750 [Suillus subluteus]